MSQPLPPGHAPRLFGTDGIRGTFGEAPLDEATVRRLGVELGRHLRAEGRLDQPVVLGGDTRFSTPVLCDWLAGGLASQGAELLYLGTVPTPCVAWATRHLRAACGIVVSASHNPFPDNGIKLIDGAGFKWSRQEERTLEERLHQSTAIEAGTASPHLAVDQGTVDAYLASLAGSLESAVPLDGLRIVLDTAHGAAAPYAGGLFRQLGAEVLVLHDTPSGKNINLECGSTHPEAMARLVWESRAHLGFAFDGDADRVILADETGEVWDGDAILYLWACSLAAKDSLPGRRIVATSMSNLGLEVALEEQGIGVTRCDVGDRVVVETLRADGLRLGGEQSGHIVHLDLSTTGDGMLSALQFAAIRQSSGWPLSDMLFDFERFPQLLVNVKVERKPDFSSLPEVSAVARDVEARLGNRGRLVLRYSGTEPLARIMLEGPERSEIEAMADELAEAIRGALA